MEITYESIKPLIKKEVVQGNQIQLEFQAKNQETPLQTLAVVVPDTTQIKKNVGKEVVKSTVKRGVINGILRAIGLGGMLGSAVSRTANEVTRSKSSNAMNTKITDEDKKTAIVKAFEPFSTMYKYNEQTSEWEYSLPNNQ